MSDNLYNDYEPEEDFEDEGLEESFDPVTQSIIRYNGEEYPVTSGQTLKDIIQEHQGTLGVREASRLKFRIAQSYVTTDYTPQPGEVIVAAIDKDSKASV